MRNGERVAGLLEDVEGGVVFVRASLHDQRRLPLSDVALIDLVGGASGLPETELSAARGANHLVLLRDGSSLTGRFVDVHGGEANAAPNENHSLIFRTTNGEERRVSAGQRGAHLSGQLPGQRARGRAGAGGSRGSRPLVHDRRSTSGRRGARACQHARGRRRRSSCAAASQVRFDVRGRVQLSDDNGDVAEAAGSLRERRANGSPLPQNYAGALIAQGRQLGAISDRQPGQRRGDAGRRHALPRRQRRRVQRQSR